MLGHLNYEDRDAITNFRAKFQRDVMEGRRVNPIADWMCSDDWRSTPIPTATRGAVSANGDTWRCNVVHGEIGGSRTASTDVELNFAR